MLSWWNRSGQVWKRSTKGRFGTERRVKHKRKLFCYERRGEERREGDKQ
jgi:hypothetical protein